MTKHVHFDFSGARVLVTGGSSGIGAAIAKGFLDAGAEVTITGTRENREAYEDDLSGFRYRRCRLTHKKDIHHLATSFEGLDILINNAGGSLLNSKNEQHPDVFEESVEINLIGAYRVSALCRSLLVESEFPGGASIINIASMASFFAMPLIPGYGAAKAGVVQLTKALAVGWAKKGIRVNAIAPGIVETARVETMGKTGKMAKPVLARTPLGRFGQPEDLVGAALFLSSPAASYITGQTLCVDGGYTCA